MKIKKGTLIQHLKEHLLHGNMSRDDIIIYYTTVLNQRTEPNNPKKHEIIKKLILKDRMDDVQLANIVTSSWCSHCSLRWIAFLASPERPMGSSRSIKVR